MRHIQGTFLKGYATLQVNGQNIEYFYSLCMHENIHLWNVKKQTEDSCTFSIRLKDVQTVQHIANELNYKLIMIEKRGVTVWLRKFLSVKPFVISLLCSIILLFILSNVVWKVSITGISKEVEEKVSKELKQHGVEAGSWFFSIDAPSDIQEQLINNIPELLWIGIKKKGTTYELEGVEKTQAKEEEKVTEPQHLIASKKGVITYMFAKEGEPKVKVHDYVEKGDLLISGIIEKGETNDDSENENNEDEYVPALGKVFANTWYELHVEIPLVNTNEQLTGNFKDRYKLGWGNIMIPVWGFLKPDYNAYQKEVSEKPIYFGKWQIPISIKQTKWNEKVYNEEDRTVDEARSIGIKQAKNELRLKLGPEVNFLSEKVLHETIESGKVNLIIYVSVEEDIAKTEPIMQGD